MTPYVDSHAHLSLISKRGIDVHAMIGRLSAEGFRGILDIGTEAGDLEARLAAFAAYPGVCFSAGIWPSREAIPDRVRQVEILRDSIASAGAEKVVAIGECGLDRHWNTEEETWRDEAELFAAQAQLAVDLDLPIIVHSRDAAEDTAAVLQGIPGVRGVIHCFSYGALEAKRFLDLGFYLSFAGTLTYKKADDLRAALAYAPPDRILLETDSPYLAPVPFRGKIAEPGMVAYTYAAAASIKGMPLEELAEKVESNYRKLFGIT